MRLAHRLQRLEAVQSDQPLPVAVFLYSDDCPLPDGIDPNAPGVLAVKLVGGVGEVRP